MFNHIVDEIKELENSMETYAVAMVVRRVEPTSGKPGDKAIIRQDGSISGWIGGGCTKGIILKEALAAMKDGKPRLVSIDNENLGQTKPGVVSYTMTCHSGGSVDVYIEPVLPKPHLVVIGKSHIAKALTKLGQTMGYQISLIADSFDGLEVEGRVAKLLLNDFDKIKIRPNTCIIVSTQGEGDEAALEKAVKSGAEYVSFVASRKKANAVFHELRNRDISFDQLKKLKTPAGLDIFAKLPEEVALSIIGQIIEHIRKPSEATNEELSSPNSSGPSLPEDYYINPVCQVPVHKASAKHVLEHQGEKVYFCCDGCKVSFEKEPEKYMTITE